MRGLYGDYHPIGLTWPRRRRSRLVRHERFIHYNADATAWARLDRLHLLLLDEGIIVARRGLGCLSTPMGEAEADCDPEDGRDLAQTHYVQLIEGDGTAEPGATPDPAGM